MSSIPNRIRETQLFKGGDWFTLTEMTVVTEGERQSVASALLDMVYKRGLEQTDGRYRLRQDHPAHRIFFESASRRKVPPPQVFGERCYQRDGVRV